MPAKKTAEQTFEQALARLEQIVAELERGDPSLEEALALFEEGTKLKGLCAQRLEVAAEKIRTLTDGSPRGAAEGDEAD
jgi:exodeoxyribonuclease VII small subunit